MFLILVKLQVAFVKIEEGTTKKTNFGKNLAEKNRLFPHWPRISFFFMKIAPTAINGHY